MEREIITTADGSHSIAIPGMQVTYHSVHGAIQESMHVFIHAGLHEWVKRSPGQPVHILEMGFGTGLNALLTLMEAEQSRHTIRYSTIELYPLEKDKVALLNYCELLDRKDLQPGFEQLHYSEWEKDVAISPDFILNKSNTSLLNYSTNQPINLVYFDAFAPAAQPELWTQQVFERLYGMMANDGILVTYCSKGDVRRALMGAGFTAERIPGPKGKREMIRASKAI